MNILASGIGFVVVLGMTLVAWSDYKKAKSQGESEKKKEFRRYVFGLGSMCLAIFIHLIVSIVTLIIN